MKIKTIAVFPLIAFLLAALLTAVSCVLPENTPGAGQGILRLTIAGTGEQARTLFPAADGISYDLTFTSGETVINKTMTTGSGSFLLEEGSWDIEVIAKKEAAALAWGIRNSVTVSAAGPGPEITITLQPLSGGGAAQGSLEWSVSYPDGVTAASLYITKADGDAVTSYDPFDITTVTAQDGARAGTAPLDPGAYLLRLRLTNGTTGMSAGKAEAFHIYAGQTTSAAYEFLPGEFTNTRAIGGSAVITHSGAVTVSAVSIALYAEAGATTLLDTVNLTAPQEGENAWTYSTMIPNSYTTVYAVEKISANGKELTVPAQAVTAAASGADLAAVTVYGIAVEKTGAGTVTVNGVEVTNTAALSGDTITLSATPGTNYVLGSLKVGGTDYNAPFDIDGDISVSAVFKFPITGVTIQPAGPITIGVDGTVPLTAVLDPAGVTGTVTWASGDISKATVSPESGLTTTVTGVAIGDAVITVSATNADTQTPVTATVTVSVSTEDPGDPNLIWQWSYAADGWTDIPTSAANTKVNEVSVRALGIAMNKDETNGGFILNGSNTSLTPRISIGSASNTATKTTVYDQDAEFDFLTDGRNIKITVGYKKAGTYSGTRTLSVYVNNNTTGAGNTVLGNDSGAGQGNVGRVIYKTWNDLEDEGTVDGILNLDNVATGKDSLANAFVGIVLQSQTADLAITSIRIEYAE